MKKTNQICPRCRLEKFFDGHCHACGFTHRLLWFGFWAFFIGAPVLIWILEKNDPGALIQLVGLPYPSGFTNLIEPGTLSVGIIGAAFCLAGIYEKFLGYRIIWSAIIALCICFAYLAALAGIRMAHC